MGYLNEQWTGLRKMRELICSVFLVLPLSFLVSCSSFDCPLNNRVCTVYKLAGDVTPLADALTISTTRVDGQDSVLLNQAVSADSFLLPVSYNRPEDVLYFERSNDTGWRIVDTVVIEKEDIPHFESIDCNPAYFHVIKNVRHTLLGLDSIVIKKAKVNYDATQPHLFIYFKNLYQ